MSDDPLLVLFDGDCGLCQALRRWVEARDAAGRLRLIPYQHADLDAVAPGLIPAMANRAVYALRPDGQCWHGARACFEALRRLPGVWGVIGMVGALPPVSLLAGPIYRLVADHRAAISRRLGLAACRIEPPGSP